MSKTNTAPGALSVFPSRDTIRTRDYQDAKLGACGVDPARYGDRAEVGLFGQDCFKQMTAAGQVLDGMVHMGQRFVLHQPVAVGDRLSQTGWVASDDEHRRGRRIVQMFEFRRADGALVVSAEMYRLKPDPEKMGTHAGGGGGRAADDPCAGMRRVAAKTMRPRDVTAFSEDVGNRIHFEPDFAARYGYNAPISQGIQTMVWMMGALAETHPPARLDVTARFVRPVFWDEAVELWADDTDRQEAFRVLNGDGKLAAEMRVASVEY